LTVEDARRGRMKGYEASINEVGEEERREAGRLW
jgi:hypothetical protein